MGIRTQRDSTVQYTYINLHRVGIRTQKDSTVQYIYINLHVGLCENKRNTAPKCTRVLQYKELFENHGWLTNVTEGQIQDFLCNTT